MIWSGLWPVYPMPLKKSVMHNALWQHGHLTVDGLCSTSEGELAKEQDYGGEEDKDWWTKFY